MEEEYSIRTGVLDMPMDMWGKFTKFYGEDETFKTTVSGFLKNIGLPGGLSARYNEEEKRFFERIYDEWRKHETK